MAATRLPQAFFKRAAAWSRNIRCRGLGLRCLLVAVVAASAKGAMTFASPPFGLQRQDIRVSRTREAVAMPGRMVCHSSALSTALVVAAVSAGAVMLSRGRGGRRAHQVTCRADALMPWKIPNTQRWQWLSVSELLLRERILMVTEYIDENAANAYLSMLLFLQSEDATKPVSIYFSSPGAQLKPALALYDTMRQLKARGCKLTTVSYSLCSGMVAFLMAAGSQGRRFATPNSIFLLAQGGLESLVQGQCADIIVETVQMLRETCRVEEELSKLTMQPKEKIHKDLQRNFYLSATEAAEYGLVDRVLVPLSGKGAKLDQGTRDPWSGVVTKKKIGFGVFADPNQPRTAI